MDEPQLDTATDTQAELDAAQEEAVLAALFDDVPLKISASFGPKGKERDFDIFLRWPDLSNEQEIAARISQLSGFNPWEIMRPQDQNLLTARATIEILARHPFPAWLPPGEDYIERGGKKHLLPDTGGVKSRALIFKIYNTWLETYIRFQHLAFGTD